MDKIRLASAEQIEAEFDHFFETVDYQRVSEIVGSSPRFENADYVNHEKKVSVELKVVDKEYFETGGIVDRMRMVVAVPENVDDEGLGFYNVSFPEMNREGRIDSIEEPLRRVLKKANRQLRETNRFCFGEKGHGLVLLALNMRTAISPVIIRNLVHQLLSEEFRSISGVMICNPKIPVNIDGAPGKVFLHTHDGDSPASVLDEILRLGAAWCDFSDEGNHGDDNGLEEKHRELGLIEFPPW